MSSQNTQFRNKLLQAGLLKEAALETEKLESPWYVKVLLAFSGWLAALFLLFFIGMAFEEVVSNSTVALAVGSVMIGVAFAILHGPKNEFVEHLALAVSLTGQALVIFAFFDTTGSDKEIAWLLVALLQAALALVMPNFVHRVFSSFVAALAFNAVLSLWGYHFIVAGIVLLPAALCWLHEFSRPKLMRAKQAIGYGLVLALILLQGTTLYGYRQVMDLLDGQIVRQHPELWDKPWIEEVLVGMVVLYVVRHLLQWYRQPITGGIAITSLLATVVLCAVSTKVQGITVGMVIMLLGFAGSNRVLLGLGMLSLLSYISFYYYLLDMTLLAKSQTLLAVGLVLLLVRWLLVTLIPANGGAKHV